MYYMNSASLQWLYVADSWHSEMRILFETIINSISGQLFSITILYQTDMGSLYTLYQAVHTWTLL